VHTRSTLISACSMSSQGALLQAQYIQPANVQQYSCEGCVRLCVMQTREKVCREPARALIVGTCGTQSRCCCARKQVKVHARTPQTWTVLGCVLDGVGRACVHSTRTNRYKDVIKGARSRCRLTHVDYTRFVLAQPPSSTAATPRKQ